MHLKDAMVALYDTVILFRRDLRVKNSRACDVAAGRGGRRRGVPEYAFRQAIRFVVIDRRVTQDPRG